jgi:hypothetical protein
MEYIQTDMSYTKISAVELAKNDLAKRLRIKPDAVKEFGVSDREFPDMALGAPEKGEMSAQMISSGWQIRLNAAGKTYEYRADKYHVRLHNFKGANYVIET